MTRIMNWPESAYLLTLPPPRFHVLHVLCDLLDLRDLRLHLHGLRVNAIRDNRGRDVRRRLPAWFPHPGKSDLR